MIYYNNYVVLFFMKIINILSDLFLIKIGYFLLLVFLERKIRNIGRILFC